MPDPVGTFLSLLLARVVLAAKKIERSATFQVRWLCPRRRDKSCTVYNTFMAEDQALHLYFLGGPDFVVGPDAPPAERNVLGVIGKVGIETGRKVVAMRRRWSELIALVARKAVHPVFGLPSGVEARDSRHAETISGGSRGRCGICQVYTPPLRRGGPQEHRLCEPDPLRPLIKMVRDRMSASVGDIAPNQKEIAA